ncbi:hypothetical protein D3C72_1243560 [compost metagenome]
MTIIDYVRVLRDAAGFGVAALTDDVVFRLGKLGLDQREQRGLGLGGDELGRLHVQMMRTQIRTRNDILPDRHFEDGIADIGKCQGREQPGRLG